MGNGAYGPPDAVVAAIVAAVESAIGEDRSPFRVTAVRPLGLSGLGPDDSAETWQLSGRLWSTWGRQHFREERPG